MTLKNIDEMAVYINKPMETVNIYKLTAYNGEEITYDEIGNPLTYRGNSLTWNGRELTALTGTKADETALNVTYQYDMDGIRTTKVVNGTKYTYYYEGGQLRYEQRGNEKLYYAYDGLGYLLSITHTNASGKTVVYAVQTNSRGDVKYIYDTNATLLCEYEYDAWGNILTIKDGNGNLITDESHIAHVNPIRYRGYYYDVEMGLYYLNSRYYDSEVGRFISADAVISGIGGSIQGYNMFAYCMNNPANMSDSTGNWLKFIKDLANWVNEKVIEPVVEFVEDIVEDIGNFDLNNESEQTVFKSNYFSYYKDTVVVKTPMDASFSFGFIGLSVEQQDKNTLNHEYGHKVQLKKMGMSSYITQVAAPSVLINSLDRQGKLPYDYYSYPWEAEANKLGGATLSQYWKAPLPQGGYTSYQDLIWLFFE